MSQVSPNYFLSNSTLKGMSAWPRHHQKPSIVVHPPLVVSPSRFYQNYDRSMQRTSGTIYMVMLYKASRFRAVCPIFTFAAQLEN